jgi:DNA helicase-2/ATP-dependent DNA helicase PcrA
MANNSGFAEGDKVKHIKFGEGVIKEVNVEDGRTIFSIDFEKSGTRNMDAAYVRLTKL